MKAAGAVAAPDPDAVARRLRTVRERIAAAAARAGRDPGDVTLVAVTKGFGWDRVAGAIEACGLTDLGENRAQELRAKLAVAPPGIRWHFVGSLQRNKAAMVAGRVAMVHSVDSLALAEAIGARARDGQDVLVEVNTSGEPAKHGVPVEDVGDALQAISVVEGVRVRGLMTMAAPGGGEQARACFATLRGLRDRFAGVHPGLTQLSMGMTEDFEEAVEQGATIVRIGTAIFGPRPDG
ncbi:MAG TPA: YggS family pyridoxal phosphate-dependent enzyme [Actinomycetota bacterium]